MPRYQEEYGGISGQPHRPSGMDPNHVEGYHGMRMDAARGQAAYGWHRWTHPRDFQSSGGFIGRYAVDYEPGSRRLASRSGYDRDIRGGGGVYDLAHDPDHLHMYNADSIRFRDEGRGRASRAPGGRYARDYSAGAPSSGGRKGYDSGFRRGYGDRGRNEAGISESWTWGPMRGSR